MAKFELEPYDDFLANIDEDFESDSVNEGANFLNGLADQCYPYDERVLYEEACS